MFTRGIFSNNWALWIILIVAIIALWVRYDCGCGPACGCDGGYNNCAAC